MFEQLIALDRAVFFFINHTLANGLFDRIFPLITHGRFWIVPAVVAAVVFWKQGKTRAAVVLLLALGLLAISDPLSSRLIKSVFHRTRPCDPLSGLEGVRCLIGIRRSWSFPSSHAVNSFALLSFFGFLYPRCSVIATGSVIAVLVGFSRVYVGVHYPADILGGALMGTALGLGYAALARSLVLKRMKSKPC
jgi:undecaprenyl-diphosphatase